MKHFLIIYARQRGALLRFQEFADSASALRERFRLERDLADPDFEVVVLGAKSEAVIRRTHSRYFGGKPTPTEETETR